MAVCTTFAYPNRTDASVGAPPAGEPEADEAKDHFRRGVDLFTDGDFDSALFEFETAHGASGNAHLLYNIAVCHYELHEYAEATVAYRKYLAELDDTLDDERRLHVRERLEKLDLRVGTVIVESSPSGAVVSADGEVLGVTPLETTLDLGERELVVSREGYMVATEQVRVVGGGRTAITVELRVAAAPLVPDQTTRVSGSRTVDELATAPNTGLRTGSFVALGVAGAAGVVAAVTGGLAVGADRDLQSERESVTTRGSLDDNASRRDNLALTTDILFGVAGIAAVTSIALGAAYLVRRSKSSGRSARVEFEPGGFRMRF